MPGLTSALLACQHRPYGRAESQELGRQQRATDNAQNGVSCLDKTHATDCAAPVNSNPQGEKRRAFSMSRSISITVSSLP